MRKQPVWMVTFLLTGLSSLICVSDLSPQSQDLDARVRKFLQSRRGTWRDMNVPASDGQALYDIIVEHGYQRALEIGTSTGRSGIWIAWALSKTGGKLITIEIDESRHREAVANFEAAGLSEYVDARLADAHTLVKELPGPFDFVFCDADKSWYTNYFKDVFPKLTVGGCYTAHNVYGGGGYRSRGGTGAFYDYVRGLETMETTLNTSGNGLSISYKKASR